MKTNLIRVVYAVVIMLAAKPLLAAVDHAQLVKGPFTTGTDVTKACLACHDKQASDFVKTPHITLTLRL